MPAPSPATHLPFSLLTSAATDNGIAWNHSGRTLWCSRSPVKSPCRLRAHAQARGADLADSILSWTAVLFHSPCRPHSVVFFAAWREPYPDRVKCLTQSRQVAKVSLPGISPPPQSAASKPALAAALKARTTVTNRWLAETLRMGNPHEVNRKVGTWSRQPDPALQKKLR